MATGNSPASREMDPWTTSGLWDLPASPPRTTYAENEILAPEKLGIALQLWDFPWNGNSWTGFCPKDIAGALKMMSTKHHVPVEEHKQSSNIQ